MHDIILMPVRWYLAYVLSYSDIEELIAERDIEVDHTTINRWVVYYSPKLEKNLGKIIKYSFAKVGECKWYYLYRSMD